MPDPCPANAGNSLPKRGFLPRLAEVEAAGRAQGVVEKAWAKKSPWLKKYAPILINLNDAFVFIIISTNATYSKITRRYKSDIVI
ncbi:hypothetical protein M1D83_07910 [Enterobacteriaceae bacterium]